MAIGAGGTMMAETTSFSTRVRVGKIRIPIAGGMTLDTIGAELVEMGGWLGVAGKTVARGVVENGIRMAARAGQAKMCAGQREGGGVAKLIM
jgi:hypothetical protein